MADPNYRRGKAYRLILNQIIDMVRQKKLNLFGFTNEVSYHLFKKIFKDELLIDVNQPVYSLIVDPGELIELPDMIKSAVGTVTRGLTRGRLSLARPGKIHVEMIDSIPEDVGVLWDDFQKDYYWVLKRDTAYLKWRFQDAPQGLYQTWIAKDGSQMIGYMITALARRTDKTKGFLMDWMVSPSKPGIFNILLNHALKWFIQEKANVVETWFLNLEENLCKSLRSRFFIRGRRKKSFLMVFNDKEKYNKDLLRAENTFATLGDSDFVAV